MGNALWEILNTKVPVYVLLTWAFGLFTFGRYYSDWRRKKEDKQNEIDNFLNDEEEL